MNTIKNSKQLMAKVRDRRKELGWSQSKLGEMIGMSQKQMARMETLESDPSLSRVLDLISMLKLNLYCS